MLTLKKLREALLSDPPPPLGPEDGAEAFLEHIALATRITKASRLNRRSKDSEGDTWVRYLSDYFPDGRNDPEDARLLWTGWRTPLVKDRAPGPMVPVTHGQADLHWTRDAGGRLCIDLESMQSDFERSVDLFIAALRANSKRAALALERFMITTFTVEPFLPLGASQSATAMGPRWSGVSGTSAVSASVTTSAIRLAPIAPPTEEEAALSVATVEAWIRTSHPRERHQ